MRLLVAVCLVVVALAGSQCGAFAADAEGPRMTDSEFFAALNLDYPGLAKVKTAVDKGDMSVAKHEFAQYLRERQKPALPADWSAGLTRGTRTEKTDTREADKILDRNLPSVGVYHKFAKEIDWTLDPISYKEWPWQLNRHQFWLTLGRAYWATGEEKYAQEFVYEMTDWARKCPVPLDNDGNKSQTWRTIEAGIRTGQIWFPAFYMFRESPSFTDDTVVTMMKSFVEHAHHLMRWPTTGNWLTMEANGLMHIGVMLPEFKEAADWRKTAGDRLYAELDKQVYPDGAQIELSTGYHQVSLNNFAQAWDIAHANDIAMPADYVAKLGKMFDYNLDVSMPDGYAPGLNDANRTNVMTQAQMGLRYFPERKDYQWLATLGREGTVPTVGSIALPFSGHLVMRSGWSQDSLYMLFDAGPFGYGHQHEDALNMVLYAYGKYMLVDPGNYPYDSSESRKYVTSTRAHNTIMVDELDQHRGGKPRAQYVLSQPMPIKWASDAKFDYAVGAYEDGYGRDNAVKVTHTRSVFFMKPEYWIVVDQMTPLDGKPHHYDCMFHLDATVVAPDELAGSVHTVNEGAPNLSIMMLPDDGLTARDASGQQSPYQGWMPSGGYTCRPIPTPIFEKSQSGEAKFAYVLYPTPTGVKCPVAKVDALPLDQESATHVTAMAIRFANNRTDYFILNSKPGTKVRFSDFETDGTMTYVRTADGLLIDAVVCGGKALTRGGSAIKADYLAISDLSKTDVRHKF